MVRNPVSSYEFPVIGSIAALATLLAAYWVFDSAMAQKSIFKMQQQGEYKIRYAFPVLPGIVIQDPSYIQTKHGNKLLTDGWWQYARKINYTIGSRVACGLFPLDSLPPSHTFTRRSSLLS
jgi:delta24(24(1))-sterol reductase